MQFLFYFLAGFAVLSALMVVFARSPISSVIHLILCFLSIAGHYILLNAQFLAIVHIIVYTGAIMVLFLFVIMLLNLNRANEPQKRLITKLASVLTGGMVFLVLIATVKGASSIQPANEFNASIGLVKTLGLVLYRDFLFPFEIASILFLSSIIGAVFFGKK